MKNGNLHSFLTNEVVLFWQVVLPRRLRDENKRVILEWFVTVFSLFTKFEFPMKNTVKAQQNRLQYSWSPPAPLPFISSLLRLLQKYCAALQLLLFLVTVKLSSYTSPALVKDLFLNFHSLPSFPLQSLAVYLTSRLFWKICPTRFTAVQTWKKPFARSLEIPLTLYCIIPLFHHGIVHVWMANCKIMGRPFSNSINLA